MGIARSVTKFLFPQYKAVRKGVVGSAKQAERKLVLLLGWGGSSQRNLEKVINFYSQRGCDTISIVMPLGVPHAMRDVVVEDLASEIAAANKGKGKDKDKDRKVLVHSFSNNGIWVYAGLQQKIAKSQGKLPVIEKAIFDSAPYFIYEEVSMASEVAIMSRVLTSVILGKPVYQHPIVSPVVSCALFVCSVFYRTAFRIQTNVPFLHNKIVTDYLGMNNYLRDQCALPSSLFMYSADDKLISEDMVLGYTDALQKRFDEGGRKKDCECVRFTDVGHVSAFYDRKTRDEYREKIDSFFGLKAINE